MKLTEALEMAIGALAVRRHQTLSLAGNPCNAPARETFLRHASQLEDAATTLRQHLDRVAKGPLPSAGSGW